MLSSIHPLVWVITILEYIISIGLMYIGARRKTRKSDAIDLQELIVQNFK